VEAAEVTLLKVKNILGTDGIDFHDVEFVADAPPSKLLMDGDVISPFIGEAIRQMKFSVFEAKQGKYAVDNNCGVIRLNLSVALPRYVQACLESQIGAEQIIQLLGGGGVPFLGAANAKKISIPLPPMDVQERLVREMDTARLARQRKLAEADGLLAGLDEYLLAQLGLTPPPPDSRKMFAVRLTTLQKTDRLNADYFHPERILAIRAMEANRAKMRVERLADIGDFIRDAVPADSSDNYLGLANVQSNTGELVESGEKPAEGLCFKFRTGDVLFARLRPYLNKVHRAERGGICSTEFHVIRTRPPTKPEAEIRPDYLATVLRSSLVLAQTRHMMTGNTHPRLANEDVVNLVVPIPKAAIQERIAGEVARRRTEARRLRTEAAAGWAAAKAHFEQQLLASGDR